jgi:hypothetical protein
MIKDDPVRPTKSKTKKFPLDFTSASFFGQLSKL